MVSQQQQKILSTVTSVFDALGFLAHFLLLGKKILQEIGWDEQLPVELGKLVKQPMETAGTPNSKMPCS